MTLGEMFTHTYPQINIVAKRITRKRDVKQAPDLINATYLRMSNAKLYPPNPEQFIKWFSQCMFNIYNWQNSRYNKDQKSKELLNLENHRYDEDTESLKEIELSVEETNEATKEFIEVASHMKTERAFKYIQVLEFRKSLPPNEQVLFDLYFDNGLSSRKIAEHLRNEGEDIHFKRINKMVNSIKLKIKATQWK